MAEQNFANHRKFVPGYHYVISSLLLINLLWTLFRLIRPLPGVPVLDRLVAVAVARVIRLEETLRMERLLPPDLKSRISELRRSQLLALRFASDEELPEMTQMVLDRGIKDQNEIKKMIRNWRADHFRL
jgi:hypothetical protein